MSVKTRLPWRMEFAAIQTKPTSVGFNLLDIAEYTQLWMLKNFLLFLISPQSNTA
jgi:hypothetical protein